MTAPPSSVTFQVEGPVYTALSRKAKAEGLATGRYARMLFEAAWAARCKPVGDKELEAAIERMFEKPAGDPLVLKALADARADVERLDAELAKRTAPQAAEQKPNPFEEKWLTATKTIQALRERVAELEKSDDLAAKSVSDTAETEALRAKITELSAQIVAAGEDRATAEAATKEAAKHLATISEMDAELEKVRLDLGQTAGWYQVALKRISDLEAELGEARAVKPITISTDELVTAIVFGWGAEFDTATMAERTCLSEATVTRILNAWNVAIAARREDAIVKAAA